MGLQEELLLLITARNLAGPAVADFQKQVDAARLSIGGLNTAMRDMGTTSAGIKLDAGVAGLDAMTAASDRATNAIRRNILAMSDMATMSRVLGASSMGAGANTVSGRAITTAERDASLISNRGIASFGTGGGSPLAALSAAALGPEAITALVVGYLGYKAVSAANQFNQKIADIVSQSTQDASTIPGLQRGVLGLAGGQNRFTPQQLEQGLYPIASSPIYKQTADQIAALKVVSQQAQGAGPDAIKSLAAADVGAVSAYGMKANMTGYVADVIQKGVNIGLAESPDFAKGVGTFSASSLAADPNKNRAFEQAIGAFAQQTNLSPRFRFDAQGENAFFQVINKSLTGKSAELAKTLNVQDMFGPGAEGRAGGLASWLQQLQAKTAGPDQQGFLQGLFGRQNALQFVRGFTGENYGSGQVAIAGTSNAKGTVAAGAAISDNGPQAQIDQAKSRFAKDVILIGTEISNVLNPALGTLATSALDAAGTLGNGLGKMGNAIDWLVNKIPGAHPGSGGPTPTGPWTFQGKTYSDPNKFNAAFDKYYQVSGVDGPFKLNGKTYTNETDYMAAFDLAHASGGKGTGAPGSGYHGYGPFLPQAPAPQPFTGFSSSYVNLAQRENQQQIAANQAAGRKFLQGQNGNNTAQLTSDRGSVNYALSTHASNAALDATLAKLRDDLSKSGMDATNQRNYLEKYAKPVNALEDQRALTAVANQVDAARIFGDSVRLHHGSVQQQEHAAQVLYNASIAFTALELKQGKITALGAQDQRNQALNALQGSMNGGAQTTLSQMQEKLQLAQMTGNGPMLQQTIAAVVAYEKANAGALGFSSTKLQIDALQLQQQYGMMQRLPGANLIRPVLPGGLRLQEASYGTSIAALSGTTSGAAQTMAVLQASLAAANAQIVELRAMNAYLRSISQTNSATAANTHVTKATNTRGNHYTHIPHHR